MQTSGAVRVIVGITWQGQSVSAEVRFMTPDEVFEAATEWRSTWSVVSGSVPEDQSIDFHWDWRALATPPRRCVGVNFQGEWLGLMVVAVALQSHSGGSALVCHRIAKRPDLRLSPHRNTYGVGEAMINFLRHESLAEGHGGRMVVRDAVRRALDFYLSGGFSIVRSDTVANTFWMEAS